MLRTFPRAPLALLLPLLAACAAPAPLGESAQAILGGTMDPDDPAVVLLAAYPPDKSVLDTCTASFISDTVLLTAAHCVDSANHPDYVYGVFPGADASKYGTLVELLPHLLPVTAVHAHPDYDPTAPFKADLGVVVLTTAATVAPLPVNRTPLDASIVGQSARIIGYGQVVYGTINETKNQATTVVDTLDTGDTVTVGDSVRRSCLGDSGGPALVKLDGVETIIGVDSYTDTTGCTEPAHYRRPDLYTAFLDMYAPPPVADAGAGGSAPDGGGDTGGSTTTTHPSSTSGGSGSSGGSGGCVLAAGSERGAGGAAALLLGLGLAARVRRRRRV